MWDRPTTGASMPIGSIERKIQDAYIQLTQSAAVVRHCHQHYLDGLITADDERMRQGPVTNDPFTNATKLTAAHPWALGSFGNPAWDTYQPDLDAPPPDGLRVGVLRITEGEGLPPIPALARFAGYGHLLITESGFADGARSLLQAL